MPLSRHPHWIGIQLERLFHKRLVLRLQFLHPLLKLPNLGIGIVATPFNLGNPKS